jgi:curved DNA-binding protein CbpA
MILSRLDGSLEISDIAALTGLPEGDVERALEPLVALGVVSLGETPSPVPPAPSPMMSMVPPGISVDGRRSSGEMGAVSVDALPHLTEEEQRRISELYGKLNKIDHYRLLGVAATADIKDVKRSYFALAKLYHPDRYFRKNVGALRPKVEAIFAAMTTAHDTLTDPSRRASYDSYLRDVLKTRIARRNAESLEAKKEFAAASEIWGRVVAQLAMDAFVQHRYAYAVLRGRVRESFALAVNAAERAIELDPTRAEYRLTAAGLYLATGRDRSALSELEIAAELEGDRPEVAGLHAALAERLAGARG